MPSRLVPDTAPELIGFRRAPATPGFHVMDVENSPREWRVASHLFYVVVFQTWHGHIHLGGRTHHGAPGMVLCNRPDELTVGRPESGRPGSFKVLEFTSELLDEWLAEQPGVPRRPEWSAAVQAISPALSGRFRHFFESYDPEASPLQLQSELLQLSGAMVQGLIAGMPSRRRLEGPPIRGTARMREYLHEEGFDVDLETLASKVGLTRFQALRSFKRRYGLPPHAYQMAMRLGQARRMLAEGAAPAHVALHFGFVDQSHFSGHFKRAFGVTPMHYAQGQKWSRSVGPDRGPLGTTRRVLPRSDPSQP